MLLQLLQLPLLSLLRQPPHWRQQRQFLLSLQLQVLQLLLRLLLLQSQLRS
jgi:hypothetical protein